MIRKKALILLTFIFCVFELLHAQNPNLVTGEFGVTYEASSANPNPPSRGRALNLGREALQSRWETDNEIEGAWVSIKWEKPQTIKELWVITKSWGYDMTLEPDAKRGDYLIPKRVKISFSDGASIPAELRIGEYFQILTFPEAIQTDLLKFTIEQVWEGSGVDRTGLCKVKAYSEAHQTDFEINTFDMYDIRNDKPVQAAKLEIVNNGGTVKNAELVLTHQGRKFGEVKLDEIPANSATTQEIWIPAPFAESNLSCRIKDATNHFPEAKTFVLKPYDKNYFDGGELSIIATNHNDLGWLNTQALTADYRADTLIAPALDLMITNPEFKYTMESIEYLKEFLVRHPERKDELIGRIREKRFSFGASYIQNLQAHVGQEKLVRQFYYGRRWLKETFPGCDTHFYINTDVPGFTYQLPQVLKKCGIDYMIQGRFPWGFYYWQGLDGTYINVFAFRYGAESRMINPNNKVGYLKFLNERRYLYEPRQLPKSVLYDFNSDYLPPCPELIPFVKKQNEVMAAFAEKWNSNFRNEPEKQINPPKMKFVEPNEALKDFFGKGELNIETVKGDYPLSWAYYDEPGHREGLLLGRKGHNTLIKAEGLFATLNAIDPEVNYPQDKFDEGWLANCWPDHGWGGNRGILGDQVCVDSYARSLKIGKMLVDEAQSQLLKHIPQGTATQIPVVVYNQSSWTRNGFVTCKITYPVTWKGLELKDASGNEITCELIGHSPEKHELELGLMAAGIPSVGYKTYYASEAKAFPQGYTEIKGDLIENDLIQVKFGSGGISSMYDKVKKQEVFKTEKFFGGEVIQMSAPTVAWENREPVTMDDFDKTSMHEFKTIRAVESPLRYIVEKEAEMKYFTLRERFILHKETGELNIEADVLNWTGEKAKELRIVFPLNMDKIFSTTYDIPFGRVEMDRDNIDYSWLPDNYECQFYPANYARKYLPFREAVNWVDVSTGTYKGTGCLFASDMTVHLFRDETTNPVDYPVVQHVLLSTRESFGWNPRYSFTQKGSHSYRMALYLHDGNWRYAQKEGLAFNNPLTAFSGKVSVTTEATLPVSTSFLQAEPANIVISTLKKAEDGNGRIVRFYETEGKFAKAKITGFSPFSKVSLTDMLEYDQAALPVNADGSADVSVKPYEIITIRIN
ncbi:MAG: glycosyl hydrolase-related protein [Mangrovibacterium sp.]